MNFLNGISTPLVETSSAQSELLQTASVDTSRPVKYISFRIKADWDGNTYTGIRLYDASQQLLFDRTFTEAGIWYPAQTVTDGTTIIGFRCDSASSEKYLLRVSILLGRIGHPEIAGEIMLPNNRVYPDFEQYKALLAQEESFPGLKAISYKLDSIGVLAAF